MHARVTGMIGVGFVLLVVASLLISIPAFARSQPPTTDELISVPAELLPPSVDELTPSAAPPAVLTSASAEPIRDGSAPTATENAAAAAAVTFDLCAKAGTLALPGLPAPGIVIWGFALKPSGVPCTDPSVVATLPGPELRVTAGDSVTIVLTNTLPVTTSLLIPGQVVTAGAGTTGPGPSSFAAEVPPGGTGTYDIASAVAGTYFYESGTETERQLPMGLYGALIVDTVPLSAGPPGKAYDGMSSEFDAEAVLVLSEIDPALNADPMGFDLLDYYPTYWLINGKAYPDTAGMITPTAGDKLLLRYLNAGLIHHTMSLLGMHQRAIAMDAFEYPFPYDLVAHTIPSGQTADMIVATDTEGSYPLYNRQMHITNGGIGPSHFVPGGGMMTFVEVHAPLVTTLSTGWNMISPLVVTGGGGEIGTLAGGVPVTQALAPIDGSYDKVFAYDGCTDQWQVYDPTAPAGVNTLDTVYPWTGLWIRMNTPDTLSASVPTSGSTDIAMCAGWNFVGYPSQVARPVEHALAPIANVLTRVYAYDPVDGWSVFDPAVLGDLSTLKELKPGEAYWILVAADTVLTVNSN